MVTTLKMVSGETISDAQYMGLSTDSQPTKAPVNALFLELDTGKFYYFDGEDWAEMGGSSSSSEETASQEYVMNLFELALARYLGGNSGGGGGLLVTVTGDETIVADKTYDEIMSAYLAGQNVTLINESIYDANVHHLANVYEDDSDGGITFSFVFVVDGVGIQQTAYTIKKDNTVLYSSAYYPAGNQHESL